MDLTDALYGAFTRGKDAPGDVESLVQALGGSRAAAAALGVSTRQVERYTTTKPGARRDRISPTRLGTLRDAVKSSPAYRAQQVGKLRAARLRNKGANLKARGTAGVVSGGASYMRPGRSVTQALSGEWLAPVLDAFLSGDDAAAAAAFDVAMSEQYTAGWVFESVDEMEFLR